MGDGDYPTPLTGLPPARVHRPAADAFTLLLQTIHAAKGGEGTWTTSCDYIINRVRWPGPGFFDPRAGGLSA